MNDHDLDHTLRTLDIADTELSEAQLTRKQALLDGLLEENSPVVSLDARRVRRSRAVRWLLPAAAAAAIAVPLTLWGGPAATRSTAYASWTASGRHIGPDTARTISEACRENVRENLANSAAGSDTTLSPDALRTVVTEQRGDFLFVAMAAPDGSTQQCFLTASHPTRVEGAAGGWASKDSLPPVVLGPHQVETQTGGQASGAEGDLAFTMGRVGKDITAVTIHIAGRDVEATVSNGHFAAWWPAPELAPNSPKPTETYDVTLANGRTLINVPNVFSGGRDQDPAARTVGKLTIGGGSQVATLGGRVGAHVTGVTVLADGKQAKARIIDGTFAVEFPKGTKLDNPRFDLTLDDGTALKDQQAA
ncbi:hypothetical protein AAEX63_03590 [Luteococcus sp. H138]|uniref:hypothetical protein n=1 Tax=unclassified Luteococcus TaxID=2639923 RepID=UPI00313A7A39